ncbi:hypothetical protein SNEBB_005950 [Seison nebaliae]|nr:hypothetical protein SNEBB_005950 [Seison nebaliae]
MTMAADYTEDKRAMYIPFGKRMMPKQQDVFDHGEHDDNLLELLLQSIRKNSQQSYLKNRRAMYIPFG